MIRLLSFSHNSQTFSHQELKVEIGGEYGSGHSEAALDDASY
jgi:hypothetical protein